MLTRSQAEKHGSWSLTAWLRTLEPPQLCGICNKGGNTQKALCHCLVNGMKMPSGIMELFYGAAVAFQLLESIPWRIAKK